MRSHEDYISFPIKGCLCIMKAAASSSLEELNIMDYCLDWRESSKETSCLTAGGKKAHKVGKRPFCQSLLLHADVEAVVSLTPLVRGHHACQARGRLTTAPLMRT